MDAYIEQRIRMLPKEKQKKARERETKLREGRARERAIARGLVLAIGLAIGGIGAKSGEAEAQVEVPKVVQKALDHGKAEKPTEDVSDATDVEMRKLESARALAETIIRASKNLEAIPVQAQEDAGQSDEEVSEELGMDADTLDMIAEQTELDLKKFAAAAHIVETLKKEKLTKEEAQELLNEEVELFAGENDVPEPVAKARIVESLQSMRHAWLESPDGKPRFPNQDPQEETLGWLVYDNANLAAQEASNEPPADESETKG
jgi:hypothetical protein